MRRGHYYTATNIFLIAVFSVMFFAIKFDQYVSICECYVYGTLGLFLLIVAGLVGNDPRFIFVLTALNLGEIFVVYFANVVKEIDGISRMMEELLSGMQELSVGSGDLLASVGRVSGLTASTRAVVDEAEAGVEGSRRSMTVVVDRTGSIEEATVAMRAAFSLILDELRTVRTLGDRNIEHVENLRADLERVGVLV